MSEDAMSDATQEMIEIYESLPETKRAEVVDFARFLLARQQDEAWQRSLADAKPRPRLEAFLKQSAAEGDEPLNVDHL
jgi:hypothetical protein